MDRINRTCSYPTLELGYVMISNRARRSNKVSSSIFYIALTLHIMVVQINVCLWHERICHRVQNVVL